MGGRARCTGCGSSRVRHAWTPQPAWRRALGLAPCRCEACGASFDLPRRIVPPESTDERSHVPADILPRPADVDLAALDRDLEARLGRLPRAE